MTSYALYFSNDTKDVNIFETIIDNEIKESYESTMWIDLVSSFINVCC